MRKRILLLLVVAWAPACSGEEANETRLLVSQVDRYAQMKNSSLADRVALVREMRAQEPTSPRVRGVRDVCVAAYDEVHRAEQSLTRAQQMFEPYRAAQKAPPADQEFLIKAEIARVESGAERARTKIGSCQTRLQELQERLRGTGWR